METPLVPVTDDPTSMFVPLPDMPPIQVDVPEIGVATVLEVVADDFGAPIVANQFLETGNLDAFSDQLTTIGSRRAIRNHIVDPVNDFVSSNIRSAPAAFALSDPIRLEGVPVPDMSDPFFPTPIIGGSGFPREQTLPSRPFARENIDRFLPSSSVPGIQPSDFVPKGCSGMVAYDAQKRTARVQRSVGRNQVELDFDLENIPEDQYSIYIIAAILVSALHEVVGEPNAIRLFAYLVVQPNNVIERFAQQDRLTELYNLVSQVGVRGGPARQRFYQTIGFDTNKFITLSFDEFLEQVRSTQVGVEKRCLRRVYTRHMELTDVPYEIDPVLVAALAWQIERSNVDCKVAIDLTVDAISDQVEADGFDFYDSAPFRRELTRLVQRYHQPNASRPSAPIPATVARPQNPPRNPIDNNVDDTVVFGGSIDTGDDWIPKGQCINSRSVRRPSGRSHNKANNTNLDRPVVDGVLGIVGEGSRDIYFRYGERSILIVVPSINAGPARQAQFEADLQKLLQKYADAEYRINLIEEFVGTGKMSLYGDLMEHCSTEITQWFTEAGLVNADLSMTTNRKRTRCVLIALLVRRDREWVEVPSYDQNGVPLSFQPNTVNQTTIQKICYRIFSDVIVKTILGQLNQAQMALVVNRLGVSIGDPQQNPDLIHQVFTTLVADEPRFAGNLAITVLNSQNDTGVLDINRFAAGVDRLIASDPGIVQRISERFTADRPPMVY